MFAEKKNLKKLKSEFKKKGFVKIKNAINEKIINKILEEINSAEKTDIYYDKKNQIRRIERIYNKGLFLKKVNFVFISILRKILNKDFLIFKDKFNAKPPGGEGFYAHYDGVFKFLDKNRITKNGWYNYGSYFINVLLALDKTDKKNGGLEIAKADKGNFKNLYKNTTKDGTPNILPNVEKRKKFTLIELEKGDLVIFSNTCAHRSKKNSSKLHRRSLYYTYSLKKNGSKYKSYFFDKKMSKNENSKSLSGEI